VYGGHEAMIPTDPSDRATFAGSLSSSADRLQALEQEVSAQLSYLPVAVRG